MGIPKKYLEPKWHMQCLLMSAGQADCHRLCLPEHHAAQNQGIEAFERNGCIFLALPPNPPTL